MAAMICGLYSGGSEVWIGVETWGYDMMEVCLIILRYDGLFQNLSCFRWMLSAMLNCLYIILYLMCARTSWYMDRIELKFMS